METRRCFLIFFFDKETQLSFYPPLRDGAFLAAVVYAHLYQPFAVGCIGDEIALLVNLAERGVGGAVKLQLHDVDPRAA